MTPVRLIGPFLYRLIFLQLLLACLVFFFLDPIDCAHLRLVVMIYTIICALRILVLAVTEYLIKDVCFSLLLCAGQDGGKRMGLKFDRVKYVSLARDLSVLFYYFGEVLVYCSYFFN